MHANIHFTSDIIELVKVGVEQRISIEIVNVSYGSYYTCFIGVCIISLVFLLKHEKKSSFTSSVVLLCNLN
jgi:hypothetical protein